MTSLYLYSTIIFRNNPYSIGFQKLHHVSFLSSGSRWRQKGSVEEKKLTDLLQNSTHYNK
ncbi:hypothetical protein Hanom_Chr06g00482081 [Helianthus anomalus]